MKDKTAGIPIVEFVELRIKVYSYMKDNYKGGKTAKRIKKVVIKNQIKNNDYKSVLFNQEQQLHTMNTLRSLNHQLGSYKINMVSLSCFDHERYLLDDGISSYSYGHHKLTNPL